MTKPLYVILGNELNIQIHIDSIYRAKHKILPTKHNSQSKIESLQIE